MSAKNNMVAIGNLGRDIEVKHTAGGTAMAKFSIPVTSGFGESAKVSWMNCVLFGKRCESKLMDYMKRGQAVSVQGEISLNTYTNKDGIEKTTLEMKVDDVALIGGKQDGGQQQQQKPARNNDQPDFGTEVPVDDDIPF